MNLDAIEIPDPQTLTLKLKRFDSLLFNNLAGLFQNRILLQFLLDQSLEFERGRLEQRQGLLQLGRQHQGLS